MTLYMIGLGLGNEQDISLHGLEVVKTCNSVYLEIYTSKLDCELKDLENLYGKSIIPADRKMVESDAENTILKDAASGNAAFLVIGDVFSATTHMDIMLRAKEMKIPVEVINNASILNAVGITGLELYKFGKVTSIPFNNKDVKSPVDILNSNQEKNMHTLFLLDLDPINNKYMTIKDAAKFLLENKVDKDAKAVGCAALGTKDFEIKSGNLSDLKKHKFTKFPQCLIIPAKELHFIEEEGIGLWE